MNSRPKGPKTARNNNALVFGGSGSGKTGFFVDPNIMRCYFQNPDYPTSIVCTDPKGSLYVKSIAAISKEIPAMKPVE